MAISTSNDEYSYARKRTDELLRRSFHPVSSTAASSSGSSASSSAAAAFNYNNNDQFSFVTPALCSTSAHFFHEEPSNGNGNVNVNGNGNVNVNVTTTTTENININSNGGGNAQDGVGASPYTDTRSTSSTTDNNANANATRRGSSSSISSGNNNINETLTHYLQQIEHEFQIASRTRIPTSNPFHATLRRYPTSTTSSSKKKNINSNAKNRDVADTVLHLTNLIFSNANNACTKTKTNANAKEQFRGFGISLPKKVCQHPFKRNDIVWVCRTCQADETCVLCHTCYDASNHEGHDVAFYHAQGELS